MRWAALFGCLLVLAAPAGAQEAALQLFQEGNAAYQEGDFDTAVQAYRSILDLGVSAPEVEYNLGNAYLKGGSVGRAVLHYRRALRLKPDYDNARSNLEFARQRTRDVQEGPEGGRSWFARFGLSLPLAARAFLAAVVAFCLWGMVRILWLRRHLAGVLGTGALTAAVLLSFVGLLYEWSAGGEVQEGVVVAEHVEVRSGPGREFTVHFQLHEGSEVELVRRTEDWREIRLSDELQGWIPVSSVAAIP